MNTPARGPRHASFLDDPLEPMDDWLVVCDPGMMAPIARCTERGLNVLSWSAPNLSHAVKGRTVLVASPQFGDGRGKGERVLAECRAAGASIARLFTLFGLGDDDTPTMVEWSARYNVGAVLEIERPWLSEPDPEPAPVPQLARPWPSEKPEATAGVYEGLSDADMGIIPADVVDMSPIRWLWPYRFASGEMALLAGDGGLGKSSILLALAAIVSKGARWPDRSGDAPEGDVIIVSAEDSRETTLKPRLVALGADLSRIKFVTAKLTITKPGQLPTVSPMSLADRPYWKELLRRIPDCKAMIIDPLPSYLGRGVNDSKNSELRGAVEPFLDTVTRPAGVCLIANTHLNKAVDAKTPLHRISGSHAYGALPRNVHFVVRDPERPTRRLFKQAKCNNAPDDLPALAYEMVAAKVPSPWGEIETAFPVWEHELVQVDLREAMASPDARRAPAPAVKAQEVADWLIDYLRKAGQPVRLRELFDAAGKEGLIGELKPDHTGQMKWSNPAILYRAVDLPPRNGWQLATSKVDGKTYWSVSPADISANDMKP